MNKFFQFVVCAVLLAIISLPVNAAVIADTAHDFSSVQGQNGWYYMKTQDTPPGTWYNNYASQLTWDSFYQEWNVDSTWHSAPVIRSNEFSLTNSTCALLRWQSDHAQTVKVSGRFSAPSWQGQSDAKLWVLVDSVVKAYYLIPAGDMDPKFYSFTADLLPGSNVDIIAYSQGNKPRYSMAIETVPEPSSMVPLAGGLLAFGARLRRRGIR